MQVKRFISTVVVLLGLITTAAWADSITVNFTNPTLSGAPGSTLTFGGTITNNTASELFLNGGTVNMGSPFGDVDVNVMDFLLNSWPISVGAGATSDTFDFYSVTVPNPFLAPGGSYGGTFLILGGVNDGASDRLNPQLANFSVNVNTPPTPVTPVPEPGTLSLVCVGAGALMVRIRQSRARD